MRIAIVINTSWNIFNFRKSLALSLLEQGHEVIAIAPKDDYSHKIKDWGLEYYPITINNKGSNPLQELWQIKRFYTVYKQANLDLILHYTIKPNIYGTLAATLLKIPVINNVSGLGTVFLHDNFVSKFAKSLYKYAFQFPKHIFFQNKDDQKEFIDLHLVQENVTSVLPGSGISLKDYSPTPLPLTKFPSFLFNSRLLFDKGIIEFLTAAEKVKASHDCKFVICGKLETEANLGITKKELDYFIKNKTIEYLGHVDNVKELIEKVHCVILPSYREGTPRSLIEAAALGRPIITTNVPGCKEVVIDKKNGYLCAVKQSEDLANQIIAFLELSQEQKSAMALSSRNLAESRFDDKIVIEKYNLVINQ